MIRRMMIRVARTTILATIAQIADPMTMIRMIVSDINWERVGGILVTDPPPMAEGSGYSAVDTSSSGAMASMVGPEDDGGGGYDPHARRMPDQAEVTDPPEDKGSMKGMQKGI
jgi:hypothetical protein